jgi:hypothetical protein
MRGGGTVKRKTAPAAGAVQEQLQELAGEGPDFPFLIYHFSLVILRIWRELVLQ